MCVCVYLSLCLSCPCVCPPLRMSNLLVEQVSVEGGAPQSVGAWLERIKMGRYTELFLEAGYSSLELVAHMTSE